MSVAIEPYEPRLTEADVQAFETKYDCTLPEDYRQFLLTYNGGHFPEPKNALEDGIALCFPGEPVGREMADVDFYAPYGLWDIALFHGLLLEPGDYGDLDVLYRQLRYDSPLELLPIASQMGNAKYFLCLDGPRRGEVLFTSYETHRKYHEKEPISQADYVCVAKSFSALFAGLDWRKVVD